MKDLRIPVIDWTTVRVGNRIMIVPNQWGNIIELLNSLNQFKPSPKAAYLFSERAQ